jgi:methyl-accepting chemotaxis protein
MSINEYLIIAVGAVVLLLIYYIVSRESHQAKQIRAIATAVEKLNHQFFTLEQSLKQQLSQLEDKHSDTMTSADLHYELEVGISEYAQPIVQQFSEIKEEFHSTQEQLKKRLGHLEENMRSLSLPTSVIGMDDERIITRFKQGADLETISKELRLSKPEVEFVLKINQLK